MKKLIIGLVCLGLAGCAGVTLGGIQKDLLGWQMSAKALWTVVGSTISSGELQALLAQWGIQDSTIQEVVHYANVTGDTIKVTTSLVSAIDAQNKAALVK